MVIYVGTKSKWFKTLETVFSTQKILADKLNMKQEGSPPVVCNASQGKNKHSGYHSKMPHWCVPLISLPWESITSYTLRGIAHYKRLVTRHMKNENFDRCNIFVLISSSMLQEQKEESTFLFSSCCNSLISNNRCGHIQPWCPYLRRWFVNLKETTGKTGDMEILPYG